MDLPALFEQPPASLVEVRERIGALQRSMEALVVAGQEQVPVPVRHTFTPGLYLREVFVPAGSVAIGKIHRHDHLCFVLGDITVYSADGLRRVEGYEHFETRAGVQRAVYAHADTWWATVHPNPTNEQDPAKLEALLIAPSYAALELAA